MKVKMRSRRVWTRVTLFWVDFVWDWRCFGLTLFWVDVVERFPLFHSFPHIDFAFRISKWVFFIFEIGIESFVLFNVVYTAELPNCLVLFLWFPDVMLTIHEFILHSSCVCKCYLAGWEYRNNIHLRLLDYFIACMYLKS